MTFEDYYSNGLPAKYARLTSGVGAATIKHKTVQTIDADKLGINMSHVPGIGLYVWYHNEGKSFQHFYPDGNFYEVIYDNNPIDSRSMPVKKMKS